MSKYTKFLIAGCVVLLLAGGALRLAPAGSDDGPGPATVAVESSASEDVASGPVPTTPVVEGDHGTITTEGPAEGHSADGPVVFDPVHEVIPGQDAATPPESLVDPIGELAPHGPDGIDLTAFPGAPPATPSVDAAVPGPAVFTAGPGCHNNCITSGVAYPRGFGAELVVETNVEARIFMSVLADTTGDGEHDFLATDQSFGKVDEFTWALDHLEPARTYYVMAAATDEHDNTSYAWGEFTTLSERRLQLHFGDVVISGGPDDITHTGLYARVDGGEALNFTPGEMGIYYLGGVGREVDLDVLIMRRWSGSPGDACEVLPGGGLSEFNQGHNDDSCAAWNSASVGDIDLDAVPVGQSRWTWTSAQTTLHTPTSGGALPPGYGDPYWFDFEVPVTLSVTYR